jgi:hypothetical protein
MIMQVVMEGYYAQMQVNVRLDLSSCTKCHKRMGLLWTKQMSSKKRPFKGAPVGYGRRSPRILLISPAAGLIAASPRINDDFNASSDITIVEAESTEVGTKIAFMAVPTPSMRA